MKKTISLILLLSMVLTLAACGSKEKAPVDLQAVYDSVTDKMPEMLPLDESMLLNFLGIDPADCAQAIVAICGDGSINADEIWLIRAKDKASLEKLTNLAHVRVDSQAEAYETYAPDQYAIVRQAEIFQSGLYLTLLIGPEAAAMKMTIEQALK